MEDSDLWHLSSYGHLDGIRSLDISKDRIATSSAEGTIRIWDLTIRVWDAQTGKSTLILSDLSDPVYNVVFSLDGSRLYVNGSGREISLFQGK